MKNRISIRLCCLIMICLLVTGIVPMQAKASSVGEAQSLVDGIVDYKLNQSRASSIQGWINGALTKGAGSFSEWYVIAISQSGDYNFASYETALKNYLKNNKENSASSRQKYALALIAAGSTDSYISSVMEDSIGKLGVMSWIYGLHLLNNGYVSSQATIASAKQELLSRQLTDGGWAVTGKNSDVDATAMTIQSLAPHYKSDTAVKTAVDKALSLLSSRQLEGGDYSSYGVANPESTAQVITALSELGIDGEADSRFIKNGNTLFDGLRKYRLADGSFCHQSGGSANENATSQAFYALVSYVRMSNGKTGLYILDNRKPREVEPITPSAPSSGETTTPQTPNTGNAGQASDSDSLSQGTNTTVTDQSGQTDSQAGQTTKPDGSGNDADVGDHTSAEKDISTQGGEKDVQDNKKSDQQGGSYKVWVCLAIVAIAGILCLILYLTKKWNKKNFIVVAVVVVLAMVFVLCTNFQSAEHYYNGKGSVKEDAIGTVTLTIRCDTVVGKTDSEYVPSDGAILDAVEFEIEENETVYDILTEAAREYNIQMENKGSEGMVYIAGIHYLYEFDFGDLSGWMYFVNGETASVGCEDYVLSDGDKIEWLYTCNMGKDLK